MTHLNYIDDEYLTEAEEQPDKYQNRKESSGKNRLKARREIEDIREQRRLKKQLDYYDMDL